MTQPKQVHDVNGVPRLLTSKLGSGGQGIVYATDSEEVAVKIVKRSNSEALRSQFVYVQSLPLEDLRIARPKVLLREPHVGYVMPRLRGMTPLDNILQCPPRTSGLQHYKNTGGLERRLRLLLDLARLIERLHDKGLVYGDLSPNNVFVPEDLSKSEVYLIDADNLRPSHGPGRYVHTPRYGAPEVVREEGYTSVSTDSFSFALLAFTFLTLVHPFLGDLVANGESELETAAFRGELPWIDDERDRRNSTVSGVPRAVVIPQPVAALFTRTFESGLHQPLERPSMNEWSLALEAGLHHVMRCPTCDASYIFNQRRWCEHPRQPAVLISRFGWHPDMDADLAGFEAAAQDGERLHTASPDAASVKPAPLRFGHDQESWVLVDGNSLTLTRRDLLLGNDDSEYLTFEIVKGGEPRLKVTGHSEEQASLRNRAKDDWRSLSRGEKIPRVPLKGGRSNWVVHLGLFDRPHHALAFDYFPGDEL